MSKKITSVALAALMLLIVALPAGAAIQATNVEIRGTVVSGTAAQSWDASTFAAFWYDLKDDFKTESLQIASSIVGRDIQANTLWYNTTRTTKTLKVVANGHTSTELLSAFPSGKYSIVGWQTQPYVGVKDKTKKLSRLIIEQGNATSDKKTLSVGETWDVGGGWNLTAQSIDASTSPRKVLFNLGYNGTKLDDSIIAEGGIYLYTESIAGETNVPLFVTYVDSVISGAVQLKYTWAISKSVTEVKSADVFGNLEVITAGDNVLTLKNKDRTISLSKNSTVNITGDMKFKVADSDTVRYYPMVLKTASGEYEIRGSVVSGTATQSWDATNFAGFWYDLKDDLKTEILSITRPIIGRDIDADTLWYNTTRTTKTLKAYQNQPGSFDASDLAKFTAGTGKYSILGWQGQMYVAVKDQAKKLSRLIIEQGNATSDKKNLTVGETWDVGGGWNLTAQSIDAKASPRQVWLVLSKDGVKKDDKIIAQGRTYVYIERTFSGESDVPLFLTYVDSIFAGATSDMVQLRYTWAISTSVTEVKSADVYGNMEVRSATDNVLTLNNKDRTLSLSKNSTVNITGDINFRVADSDTLRFYPFVSYEILPPPPPASVSVISIASQNVTPGGTVTVPIMANNITNVAAYTINLTYNPAVVVVNSVTAGALGGVTANINNATGVTQMSAFSTTPQFGNVTLANAVLRAVGTAGQTSPLTLTVTTLSDNNGITIPATVSSGTFNISPVKKGDVTGDGKVDITDALFIAQYTVGLRTLTPTQLAAGDVNCDGKIDITDALFIAQYTVGLRTTFC